MALDRQMLFANRIIPKLKPGSGTGPAVEAVVRRVVLPRRERQPHQGVPEPLAGKQPSASDATWSGARTGLSRGRTFTNLSPKYDVRISSPRSTSSSTALPVRDPLGCPSELTAEAETPAALAARYEDPLLDGPHKIPVRKVLRVIGVRRILPAVPDAAVNLRSVGNVSDVLGPKPPEPGVRLLRRAIRIRQVPASAAHGTGFASAAVRVLSPILDSRRCPRERTSAGSGAVLAL